MHRSAQHPERLRRGTVLVAILVFVLVAEVAVMALIMNTSRHQHLVVDRMDSIRAFYASESGMNMALREILIDDDVDRDGAIGSVSNDGEISNDPSIGRAAASVAMSMESGETVLRSSGYAGQTYRRIEIEINTGHQGRAPGLSVYRYTNVGDVSSMAEIDWEAAPADVSTITQLSQPEVGSDVAAWPGGPTSHWAQWFSGKVEIEHAGTWTFYLESDDGSQLWIDDELVVDNDGLHAMRTRSGSIELDAGMHDFDVKWFDRTQAHGLIVSWSGPGVPAKTVIPSRAYSH